MRATRFVGMAIFLVGAVVGGFVLISNAEGAKQMANGQGALRERVVSTTTTLTPVVEDDPTFDRDPLRFDLSPSLTPRPEIPLGDPVGILLIPAIDLDLVVVQGTGPEELAIGPGHMVNTEIPGDEGNAVISGHRTTHGAPFHDLHLLRPGDLIIFEGIEFRVTELLIVKPSDIWVIDDREGATLTLTTCNPIGSARERLVIFAEVTP